MSILYVLLSFGCALLWMSQLAVAKSAIHECAAAQTFISAQIFLLLAHTADAAAAAKKAAQRDA